jgi:hypothetical protein
LPGNRYGYPGHLPEFGGLGGFEVNFLPEYKALHDAGYNVLAYDLRKPDAPRAGDSPMRGFMVSTSVRQLFHRLTAGRQSIECRPCDG